MKTRTLTRRQAVDAGWSKRLANHMGGYVMGQQPPGVGKATEIRITANAVYVQCWVGEWYSSRLPCWPSAQADACHALLTMKWLGVGTGLALMVGIATGATRCSSPDGSAVAPRGAAVSHHSCAFKERCVVR